MTQRGLHNAVSFETLVFDPSLVLPVNQETTQKLIHVLATELRRLRDDVAELQKATEIDRGEPEPTIIGGVVQTRSGRIFHTGYRLITGIGTGVAYATGDAFGTTFSIEVPPIGTLRVASYLDKDDEGIEMDMMVFNREPAQPVDNDAYAPTDTDMEKFITTITFATWKNFGANQTSVATLDVDYLAPQGRLWVQFVARGVPNIAAGNIPMISLTGREL